MGKGKSITHQSIGETDLMKGIAAAASVFGMYVVLEHYTHQDTGKRWHYSSLLHHMIHLTASVTLVHTD